MCLFKCVNTITGAEELKVAFDVSEISHIGWTDIIFLRKL